MPGSGLGQPPPVLIGPERGVGEALAFFEQRRDRGLGFRCQVHLGDAGDDAMAESAPGPGRWRSDLKRDHDRQEKGEDRSSTA